MRPLCGAIIVAGAVIGLGLTAIGIGTRYQHNPVTVNSDGTVSPLFYLHQLDRPLVYIIVFLMIVAAIGLAISFIGLSYHHAKRNHELALKRQHVSGSRTPAVGSTTGSVV